MIKINLVVVEPAVSTMESSDGHGLARRPRGRREGALGVPSAAAHEELPPHLRGDLVVLLCFQQLREKGVHTSNAVQVSVF